MLEAILITALLNAGLLHLAHKWKLWQLIRKIPCEFCVCFWLALLQSIAYLHLFKPEQLSLSPAVAIGSATLSLYLLIRINFTEQ